MMRYQRATIYSLQINDLGGSQTSKKYSTCRPGLLWKSRRIHLHAQITMTQILLKEVQTLSDFDVLKSGEETAKEY